MSQETPTPPRTAEFGAVEPSGAVHSYDMPRGLSIFKRSVGPMDNNVYLLRDDASGEAVLVDGANEANLIIDMIADARLVAIVQTHGHWDHVQALEELVERYAAPVWANGGDEYSVPIRELKDQQTIPFGSYELSARHWPGHTPGSTSYVLGQRLFSGDTLFPGGPGNTFGSDEAFVTIMESLDLAFGELSDDVKFSPGHGLDSTIGRERPHLDTWRSRGW